MVLRRRPETPRRTAHTAALRRTPPIPRAHAAASTSKHAPENLAVLSRLPLSQGGSPRDSGVSTLGRIALVLSDGWPTAAHTNPAQFHACRRITHSGEVKTYSTPQVESPRCPCPSEPPLAQIDVSGCCQLCKLHNLSARLVQIPKWRCTATLWLRRRTHKRRGYRRPQVSHGNAASRPKEPLSSDGGLTARELQRGKARS